jgi:hypothetical protein
MESGQRIDGAFAGDYPHMDPRNFRVTDEICEGMYALTTEYIEGYSTISLVPVEWQVPEEEAC